MFIMPSLSFARGARVESPVHTVQDKILKVFPIVVPNATEDTKSDVMQELLGTNRPALQYPAFPRTWVEMSLISNQDSNTSYEFSTSALSKVLPLGIIPGLTSTLKAGVGVQYNINYRYSTTSTFIAMTSLRRLQPNATDNSKAPYALITGDQPRNELRSIIHWDPENKRTYFKVDNEYPMLGLCRFDMSLLISRTKKGTVDFIIGSHSSADEEVQSISYSVYSNFFQLESHVPTQDYLRVKCKETFSYAVRYVVEADFNKFIAEFYAHNHPKSECELPEGPLDPKGDASCQRWFKSYNVAGYYRQFTVPRCLQNFEGIPKCVVRGKEATRCPLYWKDGDLTDRKPGRKMDAFNFASADDERAFYCDKGLRCLPPEGDLRGYKTAIGEKLFGINSRCKK